MAENMLFAPLRLVCGSRVQFERALAEYTGRILGVLVYAATEPVWPEVGFPCAWVELPVFGQDAWYEVWVSAHRVTQSHDAQPDISWDGELLFGCLTLGDAGGDGLEPKAFDAYSALFDTLDHEGYPELLRVWNYLPRINDAGYGLERYREFNVGRHEAFCNRGRAIGEGSVPAACALGTRQDKLVICFLAGKLSGVVIENPRQTNAYRYPRDFGPRSPTFSRAVLLGDALLISGTASIVGSETVHPEDIVRQLDETLENLHMVIAQARSNGFTGKDPDGLCLNVYLRHAGDYPNVRDRLASEFGRAHIAYLQADVCRADLLVEIEAFWMPTR
ncbi:MAG TPA: hypothetical protein VMV54_08630 [Acidocella sp.]|nr:hypothetical protein [Acidocella sp.]